MIRDKAIIIFQEPDRGRSTDLEIPLDLTAAELTEALVCICGSGPVRADTSDPFLRSEYPIALLTGNRTLQSFGIRDGSILTIGYRRQSYSHRESAVEADRKGEQQPGTDDSRAAEATNPAYDRRIDISGVRMVTAGFEKGAVLSFHQSGGQRGSFRLVRNRQTLQIRISGDARTVLHNGRPAVDGAALENRDFLSVCGYCFYYKENALFTDSRADMTVNLPDVEDLTVGPQYPLFTRNTRLRTVVNETDLGILEPPAAPRDPETGLVTRLLPSLGMVAAAGFMAMRGGAVMLLFSAVSAGMGLFSAAVSFLGERRRFRRDLTGRNETYHRYLYDRTREINRCRKEEREALNRIFLPMNQIIEKLVHFSADLFDRMPEDEDFLCVRLGTGRIPSRRQIRYKAREQLEEDRLQILPEQLCREYRTLDDAPVVISFPEINALGIAGPQNCRDRLFRNMVIEIAARHFYTEVRMLFLASEGQADSLLHWVRLLPHVRIEGGFGRGIGADAESRAAVLEFLYKELSQREERQTYAYHLIVFLLADADFCSHPVSRYVGQAANLGVTFVFLDASGSRIMPGCDAMVDLIDESSAVLIHTKDISDSCLFHFPAVTDRDADRVMQMLAPVTAREISLSGSLVRSCSLYRILGICRVEDLDLQQRWKASEAFRSLAVPIGVTGSGQLLLDLHDSAHGPHGLIAGTTGSGKSELLLTIMISLAVAYPPEEVAFLLIDFKGGGTVNRIRSLPHLAGSITNIDEKSVSRSLRSIRAELLKRQRLFEGAGVDHIDSYLQKYRKGELAVSLPHLIIIVDEFAELKAEQPEFMKELVSASRIGRSLGVHLILATQKPAGQVSEQIWSNSRFRICLKVQDAADSNEVLKSPLAAEIREPGRAYLQIGNHEVFELFQSAYGSGPPPAEVESERAFRIFSVSDSGRKTSVYARQPQIPENASGRTQLQEITDYIRNFCRCHRIRNPDPICLPPLEERILFPDPAADARMRPVPESGILVDIGICDDPDHQCRRVCSMDLSRENIIITGSSGSGKTNVLQCILRTLADRYTPEEVSVYILDFASTALRNFEDLHHVGGVVCPADKEKLVNLFKMLGSELQRRRTVLAEQGLSSFQAYQEAGFRGLPFLVLMIDNLSALRELYFADDSELLRICREGPAAGIGTVIANAQIAGTGYRYLSCCSGRLAFHCNDAGEYSNLFEHCRIRPDPVCGRCLVKIDKEIYECQSFLAFPGEKEIDRVRSITAFVKESNARHPFSRAVRIPMIPAVLTPESMRQYILSDRQNRTDRPFVLAAGLDYATVSPLLLDPVPAGPLTIPGLQGTGKYNWIRYMVSELYRQYAADCRIYVCDGSRRCLADLQNHPAVCAYGATPDHAVRFVLDIAGKLAEQYETIQKNPPDTPAAVVPYLLILEHEEAAEAVCSHTEALRAYRLLTGRYKYMNICIFLTGVENSGITYGSNEILRDIRERRHVLFFDEIRNLKLFDVPPAVIREFAGPVRPGDAFYVKGGDYCRLKTPLRPADGSRQIRTPDDTLSTVRNTDRQPQVWSGNHTSELESVKEDTDYGRTDQDNTGADERTCGAVQE